MELRIKQRQNEIRLFHFNGNNPIDLEDLISYVWELAWISKEAATSADLDVNLIYDDGSVRHLEVR